MKAKEQLEGFIENLSDAEKESLYRALLKHKAKRDVLNVLQNRLPAMIQGVEEEMLMAFCEKIADIYAYSNHTEEDPSYWLGLEDLIRNRCDELYDLCNAV